MIEARPFEPLSIADQQAEGDAEAEDAFRQILIAAGEDPNREGLARTPHRAWDSFRFLTSGYEMTAREAVGDALFAAPSDDLVVVRDIALFSLCEHHLLPFTGVAHIAYVPNGKIVGLSKVPRLVNVFARRLQIQERLTNEIARALVDVLQPHGAIVRIEATHLCMAMRGVHETGSRTLTESTAGAFRDDATLYARFQQMLADERS